MTIRRPSLLLVSAFVLCGCNTLEQQQGAVAAEASYRRPGFEAVPHDGQLIVFRIEDPELSSFRAAGELAKSVLRVGVGPGEMTVRAPDAETLDGYLLARPGFATRVVDGRIWVFAAGSPAFEKFCMTGEPQKKVVRVGGGPNGETVLSTSSAVIDTWRAAL